jgi:TonB family protein
VHTEQQRTSKIRSLILSLIIHAALVCLLFFLVFHNQLMRQGSPEGLLDEQTSTPLTIDFVDGSDDGTDDGTASSNAETPVLQSPLPIDSAQVKPSQEIANQEIPAEDPTPFSTIIEGPQVETVSPAPLAPPAFSCSTNQETLPLLPTDQPMAPRRIRRRKRPRIGLQQLVNGFKKFSADQPSVMRYGPDNYPVHTLPENAVYIDSKGVPHKKNSKPSSDSRYQHVDDEFAKMAYYSYMKGVNQQLMSAFSISRDLAYSDETLVSTLSVEFTILKDGSPTDVKILQSVGKENIDEYVVKIIQGYTFAPLPERFGVDRIIKRLDCTASIGKGSHKYRLTINY